MCESWELFLHNFIFIDPNKLQKEVWLKSFQYKCNYFLSLFILSSHYYVGTVLYAHAFCHIPGTTVLYIAGFFLFQSLCREL